MPKKRKKFRTKEDMKRTVRERVDLTNPYRSRGIESKRATTPTLKATGVLCAAIERGYAFLLDTIQVSIELLTHPVKEGDNRSKIPWDTMDRWHQDRAEDALSLAIHHYEMAGACMWGKKRRMPETVVHKGNSADETVHADEVEVLMVPRGKSHSEAVHLVYLVKQRRGGWAPYRPSIVTGKLMHPLISF